MTATAPTTAVKPARRPVWYDRTPPAPSTLVRLLPAFAALGRGKTAGYEDISRGLLPRSIHVGRRARGMFLHEVEAINAARAAGRTDAEIRALVRELESARTTT